MRKVIAVIEWGIIIVAYVRWKDLPPLLRYDLQQHLAAKADVSPFVPFSIYRLLGRVLGRPGAPFDFGAVAFSNKREFKNLEDAGILQPRHQAVGVQPVANDNHPAVPIVD